LKANSFVSTATTQGSSTITAPHAEETAAPARTLDHLIDELPQMPFPMQRCFQTLDLLFGAFDHLFLRIRSDGRSESHPNGAFIP
jgi:hypothetical protein